ncbi:MAG: alpha/beta fold hydrolase [Nitrospirota bacterium]
MECWITVNGLKIRYLHKGEGTPFVLLHGFSFHAETWKEIGLFDELALRYSVYAFDMPYGPKSLSDKFEAGSRDEYAEFLHELFKTLKIQELFLIGASISGEVVLRYLAMGNPAQAGILAGPVNVKHLVADLKKIAVPLLAIWGELDTISPPDNGRIIADHVRKGEVYILKGAGHACYLDKPEDFKALVREFVLETA